MSHKIFGTDGDRVIYEEPEFYRRQLAEAMSWRAIARMIPGIEADDYDHYDLWCEVRSQARLLGLRNCPADQLPKCTPVEEAWKELVVAQLIARIKYPETEPDYQNKRNALICEELDRQVKLVEGGG